MGGGGQESRRGEGESEHSSSFMYLRLDEEHADKPCGL